MKHVAYSIDYLRWRVYQQSYRWCQSKNGKRCKFPDHLLSLFGNLFRALLESDRNWFIAYDASRIRSQCQCVTTKDVCYICQRNLILILMIIQKSSKIKVNNDSLSLHCLYVYFRIPIFWENFCLASFI